jgi:hypothetical protein
MTPAETVGLLVLLGTVAPSESGRGLAAGAWHPLLADLEATDAQAAVVLLARRQRDVTARDVRAEVRRLHGKPLAPGSTSRVDVGTDDPRRARALRVACPWCGAARGQLCIVPGSSVPLRSTPAHPSRLAVAEGNTS